MRELYRAVNEDGGAALTVGISQYGLHVAEVSDASGLIDDLNPNTPYLQVANVFTWERVRNRERNYSGDDGRGKIAQRLVAAAISLIGYWGGEEVFISELNDMELPN